MKLATKGFLAGVAGLMMAAAVQADTVTYSTTGSFSNGMTNYGSFVSTTGSLGSGNTFQFNGVTNMTSPTLPTNDATFGTFRLTLRNNAADLATLLNGLTFTLSITQVAPSPSGNGSVTTLTTVTGTLMQSPAGNSAYTISLPFGGTAETADYSFQPFSFSLTSPGGTNNDPYIQGAGLKGAIDFETGGQSVVPLPASFYGGAALLGSLLMAKKLRRK